MAAAGDLLILHGKGGLTLNATFTSTIFKLSLYLGAALALEAAGITPAINKITVGGTEVQGGAVQNSGGGGTLVLAPSPVPSGTRSTTSSLLLGGSPTFFLGSYTLTGAAGDPYAVTAGATGNVTLANGTKTMTVAYASLNPAVTTSTSTTSVKGNFPAGSGSTTTPTLYFGLTVTAGNATTDPAGTYTGTLTLKVTDTVSSGPNKNLNSSQTFKITVSVDQTVITISNTASLAFGAVITGTTAGTVVLAPGGGRTFTGGVVLDAAQTATAAAFNLHGALNAHYVITLPSSITVTATGGTMTVNAFTCSPTSPGTLDATGAQVLTVGATLNVGANQADGTYNGTFPVTVAYN